MSDPIPDVTDLATYLHNANIDAAAAQLAISNAVTLCSTVANPLPTGASAVVLDVAARAYANPLNTTSEGAGPFPVTWGTVSGGLWLTRQNKATLRRLNSGSGAFTIDTTPADAGQNLPWWDTGVTPPTAVDFDTPNLNP